MKVLVTGANGFVGQALLNRLINIRGIAVIGTVRSEEKLKQESCFPIVQYDLASQTVRLKKLEGIDCVIHTAARVHVMDETSTDPMKEFRQVNVEGTLSLARQAASVGVRRFVYVSSIKVNGEETRPGRPFTAYDLPAPTDPYGVSKLEAEHGLLEVASQTGMEIVIVRPPLVYGPGVKANFASMMRWVARDIPLPLGSIHNSRSLVALDNLIDLLIVCMNRPEAAGQTFLVSDGEDVSTTELLQRTARAMGRTSRLLLVPPSMLEFGASLLGKRAMAQRLCSSLQIDIEKTRCLLDWNPPLTLDQGLKKAVEGMKC